MSGGRRSMSSAAGLGDAKSLPNGKLDAKSAADALFNDNTIPDAPADDLLKVLKGFVLDYSKSLSEMRLAISDTISEAWESENDVVNINMEPFDRDHIVHMIKGENAQFNKVTVVFSVLCAEMRSLRVMAEQKFYAPLTMFGHAVDDTASKQQMEDKKIDAKSPNASATPAAPTAATIKKDAGPEASMGAFLPFLQDLNNFVTRCNNISRNVVNQLACLYHERQKLYISTFNSVHLEYVFECLGEISRVLITLDSIIADNQSIAAGWLAYKRMIKYIRADPSRYGLAADKLKTFEQLLISLDGKILAAKIYESYLSQDFGLPGGGGANSKALVAGNRVLHDEFVHVLKTIYKRLYTGLGESIETFERERLVDLYGLYALYRRLFRTTVKPDKSMFKQFWEVQKKVPLVVLFGRAVWFIPEFLNTYCQLPISSLNPEVKDVIKTRRDFLTQLDDNFIKTTEGLYQNMCMWMVRMESELTSASGQAAVVLQARSRLLLNGIMLANQIRNLVTQCIHLHLSCEMPFRGKNIRSLAICVEMLKAISATYVRRISMIGENISHMIGQSTFTLKRMFVPIKKKLEKTKRLDDTRLDVLASVNLSLLLLDYVPTQDRQTVLNIALSVAQFKDSLKSEQMEDVRYQLWKLQLLSTWQRTITNTCNCSFMYWVTNLVPAFFKDIFETPDQVNRLQYLFAALRDPASLLLSSHDEPRHFLSSYKAEVMAHFEARVIRPLCNEVETDLRLHIHSVVLENSKLRKDDWKDLSRFLNLKTLRFFDQTIDVKQRVTHYLDAIFYNMTTVTLHDWRIYAEMRNLAHEKYGLSMTEVHLPGNSHYSEALDILEIMRKIHVFVARYNYNMNTQIFVERAFDQKHINTINIHHIANSIRTHGTGIMNTTVNFTYQFLCRKFVIFSEFLYDDHIKSRLMADIRYFKSDRDALDNKFPYDRADKFNKAIRKLGVSEDGLTFVDQFRQQITEIGNALGYVRMVRSGGLHHCSNAIKFVPDLDDIPSFAEPANKENLSPETKEAATNLDAILGDLSKNFAEGTEYFHILVQVFQGVFRGEEHKHLKNFHMIVPPLTLNFVETMISKKDKLSKKPQGRTEASFTDDGFALGLAYILKLLDQDSEYDALHWFDSVNAYIDKKRTDINELKTKKKQTEEDMQHLQLTVKKLGSLRTELDMLFYSFTGARIFFRDPTRREDAAATAAAGAAGDQPPAAPGGAGSGDVKGDGKSNGNGAPNAPAMSAAGVPAAPAAPVAPEAPMAPPAPPMAPPLLT